MKPSLEEVHGTVNTTTARSPWKKLMAFLGPAYLISVGYMDPGNWATDIAGGSQFGYSLLWVLLMSNLMALLLQSLSARLGIVAGLDLAQASRRIYPRFINYYLYLLAEIAIAACDLAEVIGMAIGLNLLFDIPLMAAVLITLADTFLVLFLLNRGIRKMEAFILGLVFIVGASFMGELILAKPAISDVAGGIIPGPLSGEALLIAIGIIGATVMPHNLYLHSSLVQTRKIDRSHQGIRSALKFNFIDTAIALNLALFVNAAILILAASAFFSSGLHEVQELKDAHHLLEGLLGPVAPVLFAVALIAAGQSSTITGTLAGQIIMEGYLQLRIRPWLRRILSRSLAIIPAVVAILYFGEGSLGRLLVLSQVILSLQLGFAIIPLIHFVSDKRRMQQYAIRPFWAGLSWLVATIIVALNVKLVYEELYGWLSETTALWPWFTVIPLVVFSGLVLLYISLQPFLSRFTAGENGIPHGAPSELALLRVEPLNSIAITVDFSSGDVKAISQATHQGGKTARYLLIHVVETAAARFFGAEVSDHESKLDADYLEQYATELRAAGYNVSTQLAYGSATREIASIVNASDAQLLVMAGHGHKGWKDVIFGATLDNVRHHVKIPVLIVNQ